jgi:hypothetical protein
MVRRRESAPARNGSGVISVAQQATISRRENQHLAPAQTIQLPSAKGVLCEILRVVLLLNFLVRGQIFHTIAAVKRISPNYCTAKKRERESVGAVERERERERDREGQREGEREGERGYRERERQAGRGGGREGATHTPHSKCASARAQVLDI